MHHHFDLLVCSSVVYQIIMNISIYVSFTICQATILSVLYASALLNVDEWDAIIFLHFKSEDTEAQRASVTYPRWCSQRLPFSF